MEGLVLRYLKQSDITKIDAKDVKKVQRVTYDAHTRASIAHLLHLWERRGRGKRRGKGERGRLYVSALHRRLIKMSHRERDGKRERERVTKDSGNRYNREKPKERERGESESETDLVEHDDIYTQTKKSNAESKTAYAAPNDQNRQRIFHVDEKSGEGKKRRERGMSSQWTK